MDVNKYGAMETRIGLDEFGDDPFVKIEGVGVMTYLDGTFSFRCYTQIAYFPEFD